jgi:hypothetical protein
MPTGPRASEHRKPLRLTFGPGIGSFYTSTGASVGVSYDIVPLGATHGASSPALAVYADVDWTNGDYNTAGLGFSLRTQGAPAYLGMGAGWYRTKDYGIEDGTGWGGKLFLGMQFRNSPLFFELAVDVENSAGQNHTITLIPLLGVRF